MKAVLIDDEDLGRENLRMMIASFVPEVKVIGEATSVKEGALTILKAKPEIVFLDIEMPTGNGFQLFDYFSEPDFSVVFTTAYDHYAIDAIRFSAIDYLLKPIDPEDLVKAVHRVNDLHQRATNPTRYQALVNNLQVDQPSRLVLSDQTKSVIVSIDEVSHLVAQGGYCEIHYGKNHAILASKSIGHYESILPESLFFRCHKSFLVNLRMIKEVQKSGEITMQNGSSLEVSRRKRDELMNRILAL